MGLSAPTITQMMATFQDRYRQFRAELHPNEQRVFDRLVEQARRRSSALNQFPVTDFERPLLLAMLLGVTARYEALLDEARRRDQEVMAALAEHGVALRRIPASDPELLGRLGQTRLPRHEAAGPVPA